MKKKVKRLLIDKKIQRLKNNNLKTKKIINPVPKVYDYICFNQDSRAKDKYIYS